MAARTVFDSPRRRRGSRRNQSSVAAIVTSRVSTGCRWHRRASPQECHSTSRVHLQLSSGRRSLPSNPRPPTGLPQDADAPSRDHFGRYGPSFHVKEAVSLVQGLRGVLSRALRLIRWSASSQPAGFTSRPLGPPPPRLTRAASGGTPAHAATGHPNPARA
jgi:hypothetical protein